ncbi:hypothetical protein D2M30_0853 [Bacillus amyloliquefaciens]|nr:hypothetical protein D2M30_0853 [Bacillus amyloliquefaciens]
MGWSSSDINNFSSGPDFDTNSGSFCVSLYPACTLITEITDQLRSDQPLVMQK